MSAFAKILNVTASRRFNLFGKLANMCAVLHQRRDLAKLEPYQLHDLGLTRADAIAEAKRKPWDVSATWRIGGQ